MITESKTTGGLYSEFLRTPDLSMGLYRLPAGGTDPQTPHSEAEVYYVVSGRVRLKVGEEEQSVQASSIVYVEKNVVHRFHATK